jgi:peptidase C39-like protein
MIAAILIVRAALALAPALALDVPYLPQTDRLCGGAAAAMVFRYWGEAHADAQQFAPLVDRAAGGIADLVLVRAIKDRGWRIERDEGSLDALGRRLALRQPVIVLLATGRSRYHYVVVTGIDEQRVFVNDPSWGPSRAIERSAFVRRWQPSGFWSLVILPSSGATADFSRSDEVRMKTDTTSGTERNADDPPPADACDRRLAAALEEIRASGLDTADALLAEVRAACPASAGPVRELAGVRFAQRRWAEASALAREASALDPADAYARDLLGASLFMLDDVAGALRAWNAIGKPRLDSLRVDGLRHTRYQSIADSLDLQPTALLTAGAFERASRRLSELPDRSAARLGVRPDRDGYASVDVSIVERARVPRRWADWSAPIARAAIDREAAVSLPGFDGQGDVWSARWRWWHDRPSVGLELAAPRVAGLPGVWRVEGSWDEETYALDGQGAARESRAHGGLTVADWLSGRLRYSLSAGFDSWSFGQRAASAGVAVERRWLGDRLSASAGATKWISASEAPGFAALSARAAARSPDAARRWTYSAAVGAERTSDAAPRSLWAGAGEGRARAPLLRAHPLLVGGAIAASGEAVFGRTLSYASAEMGRWIESDRLVGVGFAGFVDVARAARRAVEGDAMQADVGAGLRLRLPGLDRALRLDVAHGLRDGANALTVGWTF